MPLPALNPPDKIIAESAWPASFLPCLIILCLLLPGSIVFAGYPELRVSADQVLADSIDLQQVAAQMDADGRFTIRAALAESSAAGVVFEDLVVAGMLGDIETSDDGFRVQSTLESGMFEADLDLVAGPEDFSARVSFRRQPLDKFAEIDFLPPQYSWLRSGYLDAELDARFGKSGPADVSVRFEVGNLGFDSPEGRFAGEALTVRAEVDLSGSDWDRPRVAGAVQQGQLLIDDFYRDFSDGGLEFSFRAHAGLEQFVVRELQVTDNVSVVLEGGLVLDLKNGLDIADMEVNRLDLSFPEAYRRYVEPVLASWTLNGLEVTGEVSWSGQWSEGAFESGDLEISDLSIVDSERNRFAMTGLDAHMRPGDHSFDSSLSWRGLLVGKINLGAGEAALDSEPGAFAIVSPVQLDVMGGKLKLHELKVQLPGKAADPEDEPDIRLRLDLQELEMQQLTTALGWPAFSGKISGQIPGVRLEDGVLDLEGQISVNVFDGLITLDDLRIERPFGVLPSLAANVEARNLDLELLTSTFSFGQISGRADGYVRDLRMLEWRPVAFDAWFGTPERQRGSKGISRQAVNHLTTLGGGSTTTALTSPLMKLFNNFSYKRLGFGCVMQNNVCEVRGVSEDDVSVLIMEGAGVPKITIRAFNRTVDWPQLLAHLAAASEGEGIRVGD